MGGFGGGQADRALMGVGSGVREPDGVRRDGR